LDDLEPNKTLASAACPHLVAGNGCVPGMPFFDPRHRRQKAREG
jgi:hypothetical protein